MKTRTKIYLAKSNRSNPTDVSRVRTMLETLDVEVVEFTGGKYSDKPLMSCDYLVVVPDLSEYNYDDHLEHELKSWYREELVPLGKGLTQQIMAFNSKNFAYNYVYIVKHTEDGLVMCSEVNEINVIDFQDYVHYADLEFSNHTQGLIEWLDEECIKTKNEAFMETKDESNYMSYLDENSYSIKDFKSKILGWADDDLKKEIVTQLKEEANKVMSFDPEPIDSSPSSGRSRRYLLIKNLRK